MAYAASSRKRVQGAVWFAGRVIPMNRPVCDPGQHTRLLGTRKYLEFDEPMWRDFGECAYCGSTVHRSQLRKAAA